MLAACAGDTNARQLARDTSTAYAAIQETALDFMQGPMSPPKVDDAIKAADLAAVKGIDALIDAAQATPMPDDPAASTQEGEAAQSRFSTLYDYVQGLIGSVSSLVGG